MNKGSGIRRLRSLRNPRSVAAILNYMPGKNRSQMEIGEMLGQVDLDQLIRFLLTLPMS